MNTKSKCNIGFFLTNFRKITPTMKRKTCDPCHEKKVMKNVRYYLATSEDHRADLRRLKN
jgi:hypothetical protein